MQLSRKVIPLIEGDRYSIPVAFEPVELSNNTVYWLTEDNTVARFENDTLVALSEGQTLAYAWSSIDLLRDTAIVVVLPGMYEAPDDYPYDMVIYASVTIHGTPLTQENADQYAIGAYVGDELRGLGQVERRQDIDYVVIRVWSPFERGERVRLRCYYRGQARAELFPDTFTFDGERHGTLSQLYPLVLDEGAEEYVPTIYINGEPYEEPVDTIIVETDWDYPPYKTYPTYQTYPTYKKPRNMKKTALYLQLVMAALMLASCNLFIDDEGTTINGDVPERTGEEYDTPVTQEDENCKITYQLKRDVRHLGERDLSYIRNVIRDETGAFVEIHYSLDTPEDMLPVPGEALLSGANDKFEWGCCHRVRNCVKEDGVYKVLGSLCNIREVYETLELDGELISEDKEAYYVTAEPDSADVAAGRTRAADGESKVGVEFLAEGFSFKLPFDIELSYAEGSVEGTFEMPVEKNYIKTTLEAKFDGFTLSNPIFKLIKTDEDLSSLIFSGSFSLSKHKTFRPVKGKPFTIFGIVIVFFVNVDIDISLSGSGSIELGKHNKTIATYAINLFEGTCEKEEQILIKEPWDFELSVDLTFTAEADLMFCFGFYGKVFSVRFGPFITFTAEAAVTPLVDFSIADASKQEGIEMSADIGIKLQFIMDLTFDGLFEGKARTVDDVRERLNHAANLPNLAEVNDALKNDDDAKDYIKGDDNEKGITIKISPWHLWDDHVTWYPVISDDSFVITKYWDTPDKVSMIAAYRVMKMGIFATLGNYCPALRILDGKNELAVLFPQDGGKDAILKKDGLYFFRLPDLPPNRQLTAQPCYYRRSGGFDRPSAVDKGQAFYTVTPSVVITEVKPTDFIVDSEEKYAKKNGKFFLYIFKVRSYVAVEGSENIFTWSLRDLVSGANRGVGARLQRKGDGKYTVDWHFIDRTNISTIIQPLEHHIDMVPLMRLDSLISDLDASLKQGTHYEIKVYSNGRYDIIDDGSGFGMDNLTYEITGVMSRRDRHLPSVIPDERDDVETEVVIDQITAPDGEVIYQHDI